MPMQLILMACAAVAPFVAGAIMLWTSPARGGSWWDHTVWGLATVAWVQASACLGRVDLLGHAGQWATFAGLALVFALKGCVGRARWRWQRPAGLPGLAALLVLAAAGGLVWTVHTPPETPAALALRMPLSGAPWIVAQGGAWRLLNHHAAVPAQRFALDLTGVRPDGRRADGLLPQALEAYAAFGLPLTAPCDGVVAAREVALPDLPIGRMDVEHPAGNFLAIGCGTAIVLLAHLQQGSVPVSLGDRLRAGQFIGRIGNSGNTSEPHLHLHAVEGPYAGPRHLLFSGRALPMTFDGRFLVRGDGGGPP